MKIVENHQKYHSNHWIFQENFQKILKQSMFPLAAPMCQVDGPGQAPTSPISSASSGRCFCLCAPNVPHKFLESNPHESYLICFLVVNILNIVGTHEIGLKGTHGSGFRGRKLQTSSLTWENGKSHENPMVILENLRDPMKFWKIAYKWSTCPGKFLENPKILWFFFEGHVKVTRNYMRKQLDKWSKLQVAWQQSSLMR